MYSFFFPTGTNPYLTFHCVNQGTILLDLAPEDKEYQSVEEEVVCIKTFHSLPVESVVQPVFPVELSLPYHNFTITHLAPLAFGAAYCPNPGRTTG